MDREKYLVLLPFNYKPSSSTVGLIQHLQYYQKCEPIVLQMWVKSKFVLRQPRYYNLLTEKKWLENLRFWITHFFENILLLSILGNSLQPPSSDDTLLRNFTLSNSIILVEDLTWSGKWEVLKYFLIDHNADEIGNKNISGTY